MLVTHFSYLGGNSVCSLCGSGDESVDHIFSSCEVSLDVWYRVEKWCKLPPVFFFSRMDIFNLHEGGGWNRRRKEILKGVFFTTCWCLWVARNKNRFDNANLDSRKIFHEITSTSFLWYRNRTNSCNIDWQDWLSFNLM